MRVVLRLQPADVQHVLARLQVEFLQHLLRLHLADGRAVRDVGRRLVELLQVVPLDLVRVGDDLGGGKGGQPLGHLVKPLSQSVPLGALPLQPVHVDGHRRAHQPRNPGAVGVGAVTDQNGVVALLERVQRAQQRVRHRVQILVRNGRQNHQAHALVGRLLVVDDVGTPIDRHLVPALHQPRRQVLGERFKPSVVGRNPADSHDRDSHWSPRCLLPVVPFSPGLMAKITLGKAQRVAGGSASKSHAKAPSRQGDRKGNLCAVFVPCVQGLCTRHACSILNL